VTRWWGKPQTELLWQMDAVRLLRDPTYRGVGVPRGDGRAVVLLPGFAAGDWSLRTLAGWLRRLGYATVSSGMTVNAGCADVAMHRLEAQVDGLQEVHGRRIALVGHSRGGALAKAAAARRPDAISHVVTLGTGMERQLDVSAIGLAGVSVARTIARRDATRRPGCFTEECDCAFGVAVRATFPEAVRLTSVYSRHDGMVRWQSCVAQYAHNVEVGGTHLGLGLNAKAYRAIAEALATPEAAPVS
jgi:pimeloyl-ACP methyl ester carboxylesterase